MTRCCEFAWSAVHRCAKFTFWLSVSGFIQVTAPALAEDKIAVQHVHLKGTSLKDATTADFTRIQRGCEALGTPSDPLPPGETPNSVTQDRYYAPGGATLYVTQSIYLIRQPGCKLVREVHRSAKVQTSAGTCNVDLDKKRATGFCDITIATLVAPVNPRHGALTNGSQVGQKFIANNQCSILQEEYMGTIARTCLAQGGKFRDYGEPGRRRPGLVLKEELWHAGAEKDLVLDSEADLVETDISVMPDVLIPFLTGSFKIVSTHARRSRSNNATGE